MTKFKLKILPIDMEIEVSENETLMEAMLKNGIPVESICGGKGICGKCAIRIVNGEFSPPNAREKNWQKILGSNIRLSCQTRLLSNAEVELVEAIERQKVKILTWKREVNLRINPSLKVAEVKLRKPSLEDNLADLERTLNYLNIKSFDPTILEKISEKIWKSDFHFSSVVFEDELLDILPVEKSSIYGVAFDIGTTTVVGYLYDILSGKLMSIKSSYNKQIKYGEDVISRIEFASKSKENAKLLQKEIVETINDIIAELLKDSKVDPSKVYDVVCSGNTVMTSFIFGNSCFYASKVPYVPPFLSQVKIKARDLGLNINPNGYLRTLPLVSAYIGGDVVADVIVSGIHKFNEPVALLDLGTNGEVVINTGKELLAASCAAGPALEGYSIRNGMRATEGAIESVVIDEDNEKVYFRTIGNVKPIGICGSGIVEAIAWMRIRGIVNKSGRLLEGSSSRVIKENGELQFVLADERQTKDGRKIAISQTDIRKIQLAKAAILSSFLILLKISGLSFKDIRKLFVAGAFGNYINPVYAKAIGLLPDLPNEKIVQIGNGSGAGAIVALLSREILEEAKEISKKIRVVELNLVSSFKEEFVNATFIPHKDEELFKDSIVSILSLKAQK